MQSILNLQLKFIHLLNMIIVDLQVRVSISTPAMQELSLRYRPLDKGMDHQG